MQRFTPEQLQASKDAYLASKRWDTAGYVVSGGLLATAAGFYIQSTMLDAEADSVGAGGSRYDDLMLRGERFRLGARNAGGSGAVTLGATVTHALLSTVIKKAQYERRKKSRGG
jgi:hypothetical protein